MERNRDVLRTLVVGVGTRGKHWVRLAHDEPLIEAVGYVDLDPANLEWVGTAGIRRGPTW